MAKTKQKPNPKDLLKKAFAHKNQDGTNGVMAPKPEERVKAVFEDIDSTKKVAAHTVDATPVKEQVALKNLPVAFDLIPEVNTPDLPNSTPDTVDQNEPSCFTDDLPPPDDDFFPPEEEDDFDPVDLLESEPTHEDSQPEPEQYVEVESTIVSEPIIAEPEPVAETVVKETLQSETDIPVVVDQDDHAPDVDNISVYTDEGDHHLGELEAPPTDFLDVLIDQAATEDIFSDAPEINLSVDTGFNDAPPEIPEPSYTVEEEEGQHYTEKNNESLSLLERVKAEKDARKREYQESIQKFNAIENERNELEEIMRQQLLKQQEEEAAKLNEGIEKIRTRNRNFLKLLGDLYRREDDAIQSENLVAIAQTFKTESTITLQSYLLINRYLHRFNIKYDMDEIRVFLNEDLLNIETPPLDFDYYYLWESNLDTKITPYLWDKHKLMVFSRANFTCELCGGVGINNPVELYPQWRMFDSNRTQILQGFLALCPKCVDAKNHAQLKQRNLKMRYESAREHIKNVNGWDDRQVENALLDAEEVYAKRVDAKAEPERFKKWKLNIRVLENIFGITIEEPQFNQRSHIKSEYQQIFEPHVAYLFGKIESDRMIKTGKTKFLSIKLDVEPMKKAR